MRTHTTIIEATGVGKIREVLAERGHPVSDPTVRSWARRPKDAGSIPAAYWEALAQSGVTSLEELAGHAARSARDQQASA